MGVQPLFQVPTSLSFWFTCWHDRLSHTAAQRPSVGPVSQLLTAVLGQEGKGLCPCVGTIPWSRLWTAVVEPVKTLLVGVGRTGFPRGDERGCYF